jgi:uncharacterized protein YqjF (DUF2071 family)
MNPTDVVAHRPWPLPRGPWVMAQTWHDLLFAHWPIAIDALRAAIPRTLEIDTFEGRAWLGVVPFRMSGVRLRGTPSLPWISAFPELNLRTYVKRDDKPGVWFFALDAANPLAVAVARSWFHLPYFRARMNVRAIGDDVEYESRRTHRGARSAALLARYGPIGDVERARHGTLEHWLTERYCLYAADENERVFRGEIHHLSWPLQPAHAAFERCTLPAAHGLALPASPPVCHFARRLDVVIWPPARIDRETSRSSAR